MPLWGDSNSFSLQWSQQPSSVNSRIPWKFNHLSPIHYSTPPQILSLPSNYFPQYGLVVNCQWTLINNYFNDSQPTGSVPISINQWCKIQSGTLTDSIHNNSSCDLMSMSWHNPRLLPHKHQHLTCLLQHIGAANEIISDQHHGTAHLRDNFEVKPSMNILMGTRINPVNSLHAEHSMVIYLSYVSS